MNREFEQCRPFLANPEQLCYARLSRLEDGPGNGQRIIDVCNGSGLHFTVVPDRCMDIVECSFRGIPIAFRTPAGERGSTGSWLQNWPGGMVTTAGLLNVGEPAGSQGLHGSIYGKRAEHLSLHCKEGEIALTGTMREGSVFGANLSLERSISTAYGSNRITILDRVTNVGEAKVLTEILYHCNFGFPLISPDLVFDLPEHTVTPADENSADALAEWMNFPAPLPSFYEKCISHHLPCDETGNASFRIRNPKAGIAVRLEYDAKTLPRLVEWKKPSLYCYALALEPTNASLNGCEFDRENGFGRILSPQESVQYQLSLVFEEALF